MKNDIDVSLLAKTDDPLVRRLNRVVIYCIKSLAILMTFVIIWAVIDIVYSVISQIMLFSSGTFNIDSLIVIMGNFLAVLIAIEIFMNIIFYLKRDTLHVELVLATALTAISRKVIVFDFATYAPGYLYAVAATVIATGVAYWLVYKAHRT